MINLRLLALKEDTAAQSSSDGKQPTCQHILNDTDEVCNRRDIDARMLEVFGEAVCPSCRSDNAEYDTIPKREVSENYLISKTNKGTTVLCHVCMYQCMYECMYVCMYDVHLCIHACTQYVCLHACMPLYMCVCIYACLHVVCIPGAYIYIFMHIYPDTYMHTYMYRDT